MKITFALSMFLFSTLLELNSTANHDLSPGFVSTSPFHSSKAVAASRLRCSNSKTGILSNVLLGEASKVSRTKCLEVLGRSIGALVLAPQQVKAQGGKRRAGPVQTTLESRPEHRLHYNPAGNHTPIAVVMIVGGFMIPPYQYDSYARALQQLGYAVRLFDDGSTIVDPKTVKEGVADLIKETKKALQYEQELSFIRESQRYEDVGMGSSGSSRGGIRTADSRSRRFIKQIMRAERDSAAALESNELQAAGLPPVRPTSDGQASVNLESASVAPVSPVSAEGITSQPIVLPGAEVDQELPVIFVGHSRGAKLAIGAATAFKDRVAALVLLDPVDSTNYEPDSMLPSLKTLRVPVAIVGAQADEGMCAPFGANYEAFYSALETSRVPRLLATLPHAGHTQLLDVRNALLVDPCAAGTDDDAFVRQVCLGTMVSWIECWCASSSSALSVQEMLYYQESKKARNKLELWASLADKAERGNLVDTLRTTSWGAEVDWTFSGL
uniref:1-alkyl-2-acetylglycerophosphocholine esterase n=1 Tax=Hanusia phi TaxID=3032 RepID=A0A7S0EL35_9CRYP|mmetsp:Transcript_2684/g.6434  ORF Transcript_2684/g.6434 Transcript_2684/m.6434 type:complete len:498 (+) Transcript_2684:143-1636(+)